MRYKVTYKRSGSEHTFFQEGAGLKEALKKACDEIKKNNDHHGLSMLCIKEEPQVKPV